MTSISVKKVLSKLLESTEPIYRDTITDTTASTGWVLQANIFKAFRLLKPLRKGGGVA